MGSVSIFKSYLNVNQIISLAPSNPPKWFHISLGMESKLLTIT